MSADTNTAGFSIEASRHDRVAVITVTGELDITTAPALSAAIAEQATSETTALIVDLTAVSFLASAAMAVLASGRQEHGGDRKFSVVADGPTTARPIKLMGLDREFALHSSLARALDELD